MNLRGDFFENVINKDVAFFDDRRTGDLCKFSSFNMLLVSRLNSDIQIIQDSLSTNVSMFIRGTAFIIATLAILIYISPVLAGATVVSIIPIMIFGVFFGKKMRTLTKEV
jgi:ABC-type bacteriocin/lantibiotic exporter with double-glycine peptidase domain